MGQTLNKEQLRFWGTFQHGLIHVTFTLFYFHICTLLENNIAKFIERTETIHEKFIINQNDSNSPNMCLVLTELIRKKNLHQVARVNFKFIEFLLHISACCTINVVFSRRGEIKCSWIQRTFSAGLQSRRARGNTLNSVVVPYFGQTFHSEQNK